MAYVARARTQGALCLCALVLLQPDLLRLRFFWGALRRALFFGLRRH